MALLERKWLLIVVLLLAAGPIAHARAEEQLELIEQEIKGGLLYNFLKYTQWPTEAAPNEVITVCLYGGDPFNGHLQPMSGRTVNQRVIQVRRVENLKQAEGCSLLFVDGTQKAVWPVLERALTGKGTLTVSDFDGFAESGGMIEFVRVERRIGVKVNKDALDKNDFRLQDRLLRLASVIHPSRVEK